MAIRDRVCILLWRSDAAAPRSMQYRDRALGYVSQGPILPGTYNSREVSISGQNRQEMKNPRRIEQGYIGQGRIVSHGSLETS
jgi:hypothetical protein